MIKISILIRLLLQKPKFITGGYGLEIVSQRTSDKYRSQIFALYNLVGQFASAIVSLLGGILVDSLQKIGYTPLNSYRGVVICYAVLGALLGLLFFKFSQATEVLSVVIKM